MVERHKGLSKWNIILVGENVLEHLFKGIPLA